MSEQLGRIRAMAQALIEAQQEVKRLIEALDAAKEIEKRLEREDLPELMREVGFSAFVLQDGSKVELAEDIACNITEDNSQAAMAWLDEHGFGNLIKTQMSVTFNREDRDAALKLAEQFLETAKNEKVEIAPLVTEKVHPSTLKSFLKEELAKGSPVPFDLFSIHPYTKVKIKPGKE